MGMDKGMGKRRGRGRTMGLGGRRMIERTSGGGREVRITAI